MMEAVLRGIPCVSSAWGGLPEANPNPRLRVHTTLSYDHARSVLHHGISNDELEISLAGLSTPLDQDVSPEGEAGSGRRAVDEEATEEEVEPYARVLRPLLADDETLRREGTASRDAFLSFASEREHGLRELIHSAIALAPAVPSTSTPLSSLAAAAGFETVSGPRRVQWTWKLE